MKAIPTEYEGVEFRSRTEARHAVLFDESGFRWLYEAEGFDLDGTWYVPDFRLPEIETWVEVKGQEPDDEEFLKASKLAIASKETVVISWGYFESWDTSVTIWTDNRGLLHSKRGVPWLPGDVEAAREAARAYRFDWK